jgi:hypothetical protein
MAGLEVGHIDLWEGNEAFATVPLYFGWELGIDLEIVNVLGGALAIWYALGCTGIRLMNWSSRRYAMEGDGQWLWVLNWSKISSHTGMTALNGSKMEQASRSQRFILWGQSSGGTASG